MTTTKGNDIMAEPEFTRGPARRPAPVIEDPILQWAIGLPTTNRQIYAGWMLEAGKHDSLDIAMHEAGYQQVTIKHGSGAVVTHWAVETANVFVIAEGVQTPAEMRGTDARYGIAYGWRTTESGRRQSVLKVRVLLHELLRAGCYEPLTLTVKSTLTGDVLDALMRQYDVLNAVDGFRQDDGKPVLNPPLYACSLPLVAGDEVTRGSGANTKPVVPPVAGMPVLIGRDYIRAHWIKRDWTAYIEAALDDTIRWSVAESQRIATGSDAQLVGRTTEERI